VKTIKDESFSNELKQLQEKLVTFHSKKIGSKVEYKLNVAINLNEIDNGVKGLQYINPPK
jgi:hypothetical protein